MSNRLQRKGTPAQKAGIGPGALEGIEVVPMGEVSDRLLGRIAAALGGELACGTSLAPAVRVPHAAYYASRGQHNASMILNALRPRIWKKGWKRLGVLGVDLFADSLNFVFGQADLSGEVAVMSLERLRGSFYGLPDDDELLAARAVKEALHEVGHTLGLAHCKIPCVMYFSNSLSDTDMKDARLCATCRAKAQIEGKQ